MVLSSAGKYAVTVIQDRFLPNPSNLSFFYHPNIDTMEYEKWLRKINNTPQNK
jgi:hypothetical protein